MKVARSGFTLIELMVSISILSIMMIFLYQSYSSINSSNKNLKNEIRVITDVQKLKKVIYLDFSLALHKSVKILNQDAKEDVLFFQSSNSLHKRYEPYIAYIVKKGRLYRLESLQEFKEYPLAMNSEFDVDYLGDVNSFRVYKSTNDKKELYLVHIKFKNIEDILLKVKVLNK